MEHYEKGELVEVELDESPFAGVEGIDDINSIVVMRVKYGSKIRNLMGYAMRKIKEEATKHIIFSGSGPAVTKTITCVEIMKRKMKTLHQISRVYFKRIEEFWEPKDEGLDRLKVTRNIPAISVLLSKEQLDPKEPGYQAPGSYDALWAEHASQEKAKTAKAPPPPSASKRKRKDKPQHGSKSTDGQSNQKKPPRRKNKNQGGDKSQNRGQMDGKGDSRPRQQQQ
ncbi:ribonuclease P protein subunit p25-like protein [Amphiura filiformis]|uniref:ribonuclease P protein subunit p25-like protein n=1 Tax=Amphiura filiformis TaxID=82378 RepID=UPI003B212609